MMYLAKRGYVHRDLAARNILLTESKQCKVCMTDTKGFVVLLIQLDRRFWHVKRY